MTEIKGKDRVSTNDNVKEQSNLGFSLLQHVENQVRYADTKAHFVLTVNSLLAASTILSSKGIANSILNPNASISVWLVSICAVLILVTFLVSTFYSLRTVIPNLSSPTINKNIFYFGDIAQLQEKEFFERFTDVQGREKMLISEVFFLAKSAKRKYGLVRTSLIFLSLTMFFWSVMQILIMFS
ncbi:MAG: Pycsar system effector family protein [Chloroflexota bacterium]